MASKGGMRNIADKGRNDSSSVLHEMSDDELDCKLQSLFASHDADAGDDLERRLRDTLHMFARAASIDPAIVYSMPMPEVFRGLERLARKAS